jgi:hypothetical protein
MTDEPLLRRWMPEFVAFCDVLLLLLLDMATLFCGLTGESHAAVRPEKVVGGRV